MKGLAKKLTVTVANKAMFSPHKSNKRILTVLWLKLSFF